MFAEVSAGAVFLVSILPSFWVRDTVGSFLRFDLWYVTLAAFFLVTSSLRGRS